MISLKFLLLLFYFIFVVTSEKVFYEAEDGELNGVTVFNDLTGFSGTGYVGKFEKGGNSVTVTVDVEKAGMYDLSIIYNGSMGKKINTLLINGENGGDITFEETTDFQTVDVGAIFLNSGKNTIGISATWGWMFIDAFVLNDTPNAGKDVTSNLNKTLVNPKAIPAARKLYDFLRNNYGKKILSGQVGAAGKAGDEGDEFQRILKVTGKLPAVWNLDFIFESNDCTWRPTNPDISEMAINWWKKYEGKGIMTAQWHWNIAGKTGNFDFYKKGTTFDIEQAVIEGTWEYEKIIKDIDRVSGIIKEFQEINMPLIWRPLHENNGDWFWWGNNPKACAKLWMILYDRMVNYHGLNNLIWLWNGNNDENTPIDYIDLIGVDIYADDHAPQTTPYNNHLDFYEGKKMVVLSENGRIPNIQQCVDQGAWWGYFMTWNLEFILEDKYHTDDQLIEYYNHENVINMDELPSFAVTSYDPSTGDDEDNDDNDDNDDNVDQCFSVALGYPCCSAGTEITYVDSDGKWGYINNELNNWCGISSSSSNKECWAERLGYKCCVGSTFVYDKDQDGLWGSENGEWCGII